MSFLSKLWEFFTPKVIFVGQSELSTNIRKRNPRKLKVSHVHLVILQELKSHGKIASQHFVQQSKIPSSDRRLNDCYHLGLVDMTKEVLPGVGKRFHYFINEEGLKLIK